MQEQHDQNIGFSSKELGSLTSIYIQFVHPVKLLKQEWVSKEMHDENTTNVWNRDMAHDASLRGVSG